MCTRKSSNLPTQPLSGSDKCHLCHIVHWQTVAFTVGVESVLIKSPQSSQRWRRTPWRIQKERGRQMASTSWNRCDPPRLSPYPLVLKRRMWGLQTALVPSGFQQGSKKAGAHPRKMLPSLDQSWKKKKPPLLHLKLLKSISGLIWSAFRSYFIHIFILLGPVKVSPPPLDPF